MNMLLDYSVRVPNGLASTSTFIASFDVLTLAIAALDSIPLAVLSLTSAMLLHRLSESETDIKHAQHDAAMTSIQNLASQVADLGEKVNACEASIVLVAKPDSEPSYECPNCLTELASKGQWMAAKKYGYCRHCKPVETNGNGNGHQQESVAEMEVLA
jgi:outer membrane murein-binding lipoprotein Lpp